MGFLFSQYYKKLEDFEKSLDTLMKSYKEKLIQNKISNLNKDFEV